jgi:hypothetical protein
VLAGGILCCLLVLGSIVAVVSKARSFFNLAAFRATFGFIGKTFGRKELLFTCIEYKCIAAVSAGDVFVCKAHLMASFL